MLNLAALAALAARLLQQPQLAPVAAHYLVAVAAALDVGVLPVARQLH